MRYFVNNYYMDMAPYASLSLLEVFDLLRKIPFVFDPLEWVYDKKSKKYIKIRAEFVKRPYFTIERIGPGGDCDDKAVAIAAWAELHGYLWRFKAVGTRKRGLVTIPLTHVFAEIKIGEEWIVCDCTYRFNVLGQPLRRYDRSEVI